MSLFDALRHRLRPLFRSREYDRGMEEEFRHHLELGAQEFPDQAGARFGSLAYYKEEHRRMTAFSWLDPLGQDLRYAWRNLRRTPAFTAVAVLSLAIGIGANSAIFSLIYSILLRPLPVSHPERLVLVQYTGPDLPNDEFSYNEYRLLRQSPGFRDFTALGGADHVPIVAGAIRTALTVDAVTGDFFPMLGLEPERGRLITPDDERTRAPVVVISDALWTEWFNRAESAVGSTITMRGTAFTVIGVTPATFRGLEYPWTFAAAMPLGTLALVGASPVEDGAADSATIQLVGRLGDRSTLPAAGRMLDATYRSCCATPSRGTGVQLTNIAHGIPTWKFDVRATYGRLLLDLLGAAGVVLLAACANLCTLLLARASTRERELAVRLSLGASRRRLASQLLVESGLLAVLGAGAGLLLANWALGLIAHRLPGGVMDRQGLALTGEVLAFTVAVAVASVVLFGALPAWRATRTNLIGPLNEGGRLSTGRSSAWIDRCIVVAQVALALVLLNGAGLLVATLRSLRNVRGEFATERLVSLELDSRGTPYETGGLVASADRLVTRAARIPGVQSAALSQETPIFGGRNWAPTVLVEGYTPSPDQPTWCWFDPVSPGFFSTIGIALRQGRDFSDHDQGGGGGVAIVNESFVRKYLRGRTPLGATVRAVQGADTLLLQVVGVVADARFSDLRAPAPPMAYVPLAQYERIPVLGRLVVLTLTVRTAGDDRALSATLRNAVLAEVPDARIFGPETIESSIDASLNRETLAADLATLFGAVAVILASVGLYGVVSYRVAQRTREIGVRMALGAAGPTVVWMVLKQAITLASVGVLVGVPLALAGGRGIAAALYGLAGQQPLFLLGAAVLLVVVAVAASALPARRAARVDPLTALRAE